MPKSIRHLSGIQVTRASLLIILVSSMCHLIETRKPIEYFGRRSGYIIGGQITTIEKYPFIVSLQNAGGHFCGGTILGKLWILTAAHCVTVVTFLGKCRMVVVAGISDSNDRTNNSNRQRIEVRECYAHSRYSERTVVNDIALVRLKKPLKFTDTSKPVKLGLRRINRNADMASLYDECTAIGWGWTSVTDTLNTKGENLQSENLLRYTKLPTVSMKHCQRFWSSVFYNLVHNLQMCTFDPSGRCDVFRGDSGGPLMCGGRQQGIMSFVGNPNITYRKPTVYTRVDQYRGWIRQVVASGVSRISLAMSLVIFCFVAPLLNWLMS